MADKFVFVTCANGRIHSVKAVAENTAAARCFSRRMGAPGRVAASSGSAPLLTHGMLVGQIATGDAKSLWLRISEGRFLKHQHMTTKRRCVSALDLEPLVRKRFDEFAIRSRRNAGNDV